MVVQHVDDGKGCFDLTKLRELQARWGRVAHQGRGGCAGKWDALDRYSSNISSSAKDTVFDSPLYLRLSLPLDPSLPSSVAASPTPTFRTPSAAHPAPSWIRVRYGAPNAAKSPVEFLCVVIGEN